MVFEDVPPNNRTCATFLDMAIPGFSLLLQECRRKFVHQCMFHWQRRKYKVLVQCVPL